MGYRYVVLGAGMQGVAAAYDLLRHGEAASLVIADRDGARAAEAQRRLRELRDGAEVASLHLDAADSQDLEGVLRGADGALSALPYLLNPEITAAAVRAGCHLCDLGGHTGVVRTQLGDDAAARERGVSVVPDCGIAPGLVNVIAAGIVARDPEVQHLHVRCGGLPRTPKPPLGYKLVFNIDGLLNEYSGEAEFLRDGEIVRVAALSELEELEFPAPVGRCEAAVTSGGTSTCPETFQGRLQSYDYKTVRYPGHFEVVRAIAGLGLLGTEVLDLQGHPVVPRQLLARCAAARLDFPDDPDLLVLRVRAMDVRRRLRHTFELLDDADPKTGFSAMERCTGFPAAATLHLQVRGQIPAGVAPPERCVDSDALLDAVRRRGLDVQERRETRT